MQHYEVVIQSKGSKGDACSPETCEYEEAERQVDEIRPKIGKADDLGLPWFAGSGENVMNAHFRPVDKQRKRGESPTVAALVEDFAKKHPELVVDAEALDLER